MSPQLRTVKDVAAWRLCVGCGACAYACPEGNISLVDIETDGLRPRIKAENCKSCGECVQVCPGVSARQLAATNAIAELVKGWGNVLQVWEGYAADPDVRFSGSSGGLATALALYCLEKGGMSGVLHTGPDADQPLSR